MAFRRDEVLLIPELAAHLGLTSSEFIVEQVLKGGMGECARIAQGGSAYALKIIQSQLIEDSDSWQRYLREVKLWITLSACDGVAEALCAVRINELPAVCSRWMNGGNLRQHLHSDSPEFFFSVMGRIIGPLAWAHNTHGVIHRDLKPDNILLDDMLRAHVSDWGLARRLAAPDSHRKPRSPVFGDIQLTQAGLHVGTILYSSPEQILGRTDLDHRTDIYSLGCLMYEWEAGRCPFYAHTAQEIALKHLFEQPKRLGSLFGKTKFGVEDIISACLQKNPANRPNYDSLGAALKQAAQRRGVRFERSEPALRYKMPLVGGEQFQDHMRTSPNVAWNRDRTYAVVERDDIRQYLPEADALMATGDYRKAEAIFARLFVPEVVCKLPDYEYHQTIANNYALCLTELGRPAEAIEVLRALHGAENKPVAYYINLSLAQIRNNEYVSAVQTATAGLRLSAGDPDLLGNLLTAQTAAGMYPQAAETARVRLGQIRDVHSLHEVSLLHSMYADSIAETDWPLAFKNYRHAVDLLREAKSLNSRYLRVRFQLPTVLEKMGAYATCSDEIATTHELPMNNLDRLNLVYLQARCLDRASAYQPCREFCDRWLKQMAQVEQSNPVPRWCKVRLERIRAVIITDGLCIGNRAGAARVTSSPTTEFFAQIVREPELREASDFCYLARWHEWIGSIDDAYSVLNAAEALYPDYWAIPFRRAEFQLRAGHPDNAVESADRATNLAPWRPQAWYMLAEALHGAGKNGSDTARQRAEAVRTVRKQLCESFENA